MVLPYDEIPKQIVPMILYRMKERIETLMVEDVPTDNPTRAILVKIGRFQDNPLQKNVSISISGGDFEDPSYLDGRIDHEDLDAISIRYLPVGEIGGGIYWWRRGTVNYQTFFVRQRYDEERALRYAYDFQGRFIKALESINVGDLKDDYLEQAYGFPFIESVSFFESGGNNQYIWRGKLYWRVLTFRP